MGDRNGQRLGNYQLMQQIGQGAFAEVYLGEHVHLGNLAAIKVLNAPVATATETKQFLAEARRMAQLSHPHIVRVLDFGLEGVTPYLVLEYAQGGSLRKRYPRGTRLLLPELVTYVQQIAEGLDYAHHKKLIHRDIKPENLLLNERDEVLISDFGIAVMATAHQLPAEQIAGTLPYMAPEQLDGQPQQASDQYALGIVVYEWLTGTLPFHGSWAEIAAQQKLTPPPSFHQSGLLTTAAVEKVVRTALEKDPNDRFPSVQAFAQSLATVLEEEGALVAPLALARESCSGSFITQYAPTEVASGMHSQAGAF